MSERSNLPEVGEAVTAELRDEVVRLRAIEEAARWHLSESACRGWPQGEVLALALGMDPESPQKAFRRLARAMGIDVPDEDLEDLL